MFHSSIVAFNQISVIRNGTFNSQFAVLSMYGSHAHQAYIIISRYSEYESNVLTYIEVGSFRDLFNLKKLFARLLSKLNGDIIFADFSIKIG